MSRKQNRIGNCKRCNDKAYLSKRKLCLNCSTLSQVQQQQQLKVKKGMYYDQWREALKRYANED